MGICAQAASSAYESAHDPRIKAVGLVSPSLDGAELAGGTFFLTRWGVYLLGGVVRILYALGINPRITAFPETEAQRANATPMQQGMAGFYAASKVGSHPRWKNALSMTSFPGIASLHLNDHAPKFANMPVHIEAGSVAQSLEKHIAKLKKLPKYEFWNMVGSQAIQDICQRIDRSYQLFFKYKAGKISQRFARPSFRKVKKYTSFTLKQAGWKLIGSNKIRIQGRIYKFSKSREILGTVKTVTIKRTPLGKLFVCFAVETEQEEVNRLDNTIVGTDFGLKTFLTLSNGEEIASPEFFKTNLKEIRKANRAMSWKKEGSSNWRKAKDNLNRVHERIANSRRDWFFKLAHNLTERFDIIVLETLNIKAMHKLWGRKVSDIAFSEFRDILQYIAAGKGKLVHFIDRFSPSSKTCSCCGHINQDLTLNDRRWRCPSCNTVVDRDANAAVNIEREGASSLGLGNVRPASSAIPV